MVLDIYFSKQSICANGVCFARLPKLQTSTGKVAVTFSDTVFGDGPREELMDFQLLKTVASTSSMAHSYEHFSD